MPPPSAEPDSLQALAVVAVSFACLVALFIALYFVGRSLRRSKRAGPALGAAMAAYNEAMNSTAYEQFVEVEADRDRGVVAPSAAPGSDDAAPIR
jgi:predicted permease